MTQPAPQNPEPREPQTPLQILPAMLHAVFCQTADAFNAPQRQQPRAVMYTNAQMRMSIPTCNARFQYALDLLEIDILSAKAVLHRDLAIIRKEAEAKHAERALQERLLREAEEARKRTEAEAAAAAAAKLKAEQEAAERKRKALEDQKRRLQAEKEEAERQRLQQLEKEEEKEREKEKTTARRQTERKPDPIIVADAPANMPNKDPTPQTAGFNLDYLFEDGSPTVANAPMPNARPPPPLPANANVSGAQNFDDFLASIPVSGVAQPAQEDHTMNMGEGQPLEEGDNYHSDFDFFIYGGT
ncbi:hypothetical protein RUND412_005798 [Rhizina undulata]